MRIFNINIYRDGGSIEFYIERDSHTKKIWLETPFRGEPRALRIDSVTIGRGDAAVSQLLADIDEWWAALSPDVQQRIREVMTHEGTLYIKDDQTLQACELRYVSIVREYVAQNYAS